MTDLWRDYMAETYRRVVVYAHDVHGERSGFLTYEYQDGGRDLYIADIFVRPDVRRTGVAADLFGAVRNVARLNGCTRILGTVDVTRAGWRESIAAQEAVGFVLSGTNDRGQAVLVYALNEAGE